MSNEKMLDSDLELEDKLAVAGVLLLAGLFLWQFWENEEKVVQIFQSDAEEERVNSSTFFYGKEDNVVNDVSRRPLPTVRREKVITKTTPDNAIIPFAGVETKAPAIDPETHSVTESVKAVKQVIDQEPVFVKTIETVIPEPIKKILITPTIRPVYGDFSQGLVKLSGKGEPERILQLLVNGNSTANIGIDKEGFWSYETILKPGDYSLQVLMPEQADANKSPKTHITIPQLPVTKIEEKVIQSVEKIVAKPVLIKKEVIPKEVEIKSVMDQSPKNQGDLYRVKYGDTLNKLSRRYNVKVIDLAKMNNISDKDIISVGEMLIIPGQ